MTRNKGVTIAALIIAIVGLSIGFAAFSNTLTIRSGATVTPDSSTFSVKFSKVSNADQTGPSYKVTPTLTHTGAAYENGSYNATNFTASDGEIDSSNPLLFKDLQAHFTEPGQTVTYHLYVRNTGSYTAYLTNLDFKDIAGGNSFIDCTGSQVTSGLLSAVCGDITVSVTIGEDTYTSRDQELSNEISEVSLAPGASEEVYVVISYANNGNYPDGPVTVEFGDIMLQYRSVDTPLAIPDPEPEDIVCGFISTEAGTITDYVQCGGYGTNVVIPAAVPLYRVASEEFNHGKCVDFYDEIFTSLVEAGLEPTDVPDLDEYCYSIEHDPESVDFSNQQAVDMFFTDRTYELVENPNITEYRFNMQNCIAVAKAQNATDEYANQVCTAASAQSYETLVEQYGQQMADAVFDEVQLQKGDPIAVDTIGYGAFLQKGITSLSIGNNITEIGAYAFYNNSIQSLSIPNTVISLGDYAFSQNIISSLTISNALTTLSEDVFSRNRLTSVTIPSSVTTISAGAFEYNFLTSISVPDNVTFIGNNAFNFNNLTTVTIGTDITRIENYAFSNETSGDSVYGPNQLQSVTIDAHQADVNYLSVAFRGFNGTICWVKDGNCN